MASTFIDTKPFIKDELVAHYEGEYRSQVKVVAVEGDVVTVVDSNGWAKGKFSPRASDGMFVRVGSPEFEVMPTMIYHREEQAAPVAKISRRSFFGFFK